MKSAVSVALAMSLLLHTVPAQAQTPLSTSQLSNWGRVRAIIAGSPVHAVYVGRRQEKQYFISATDETLTVLTPASLPRDIRNTLIEIARTQPGFFTTTKWMEFTHRHVQITPDGIWRKGHRIAGLEDFVTTVDRGEVAEVSREILVRRPPQLRSPFSPPTPDEAAGAGAGVAGGLLTLGLCEDRCHNWVYLAGFIGPMIAVAIIQARHRDRDTELVYRAP